MLEESTHHSSRRLEISQSQEKLTNIEDRQRVICRCAQSPQIATCTLKGIERACVVAQLGPNAAQVERGCGCAVRVANLLIPICRRLIRLRRQQGLSSQLTYQSIESGDPRGAEHVRALQCQVVHHLASLPQSSAVGQGKHRRLPRG